MKKILLTAFLASAFLTKISGQCLTINCPSNVTGNNDPGICGTVVTYLTPTYNSTCAAAIPTTFTYTGAMQTYVVPAGITTITIETWGAQGGSNWGNNVNFGGYSKADFPVTPGETLYIYVGQQPTTITGGFNGGGNGEGAGKGGGGASDVRQGGNALTDRIIVGGAGGGAGYWSSLHVVGGVGGGLIGGDGYRDPSYGSNPGGRGGTQTGGGADGTCISLNNPICAGGLGYGGAPSSCGCEGYGGGGGYYGGAGSGNCRGGGGGSGYILPTASNPTMTSGIRVGNGQVVISYNGPAPATITQTTGLASGSTFPIGITTNSFTASDAFGNSATCSFLVTIADNEAPVIAAMPSSVSVGNDAGQCGAIVTWTAPTITDNCLGAIITQSNNSGDFFPTGSTTVTYSATDGTYTTTASFTITVTDTEAPIISGIAPVSVNNDPGQCGAIVTWTAPTVTDNCSGVVFTQSNNSGDFFPIGNTLVSINATDGVNTAASSFLVTVTDNESPVISACPNDITSCPGVVTFSDPTATDNCSVTVAQMVGPTSGSSLTAGNYTVSYTATDGSGNTNQCSFMITINPNPTVVLNLSSVAFKCVDDATFTLPTGTPSGGTYAGNGVSGTMFDPGTAGVGMQAITYVYVDANGCSSSTTDTINVSLCTGLNENGVQVFSMYPNPASGFIIIASAQTGTMEILDVNGKVIKSEKITTNKQEIDLSGFANGTYVVRFIYEKGTSMGQLLIQK